MQSEKAKCKDDKRRGLQRDRGSKEVVGELLLSHNKTIAGAESCTGGLVSHWLTNVPGSSRYFKGGVVAYGDDVKIRQIGVLPQTIERFGAVSVQTAREMAEGVRGLFAVDIGFSVTGICGPGGATEEKPIGLVDIGIATQAGTRTDERRFEGSRIAIKTAASQAVLDMVRDELLKND